MLFPTPEYLAFLIVVTAVYFLSNDIFRLPLLLVASLYFYASQKAPYLFVSLLAVVSITYLIGITISYPNRDKRNDYLFYTGISLNIAVLFAIKYLPYLFNLFNAQLTGITGQIHFKDIPLGTSIGVSYFVFQAISYLIDIKMESAPTEKNFFRFALYMCFFPKILQGPIERANDLLPQLNKQYHFDYNLVRTGILLFAWGMFKKVVIADRLGLYVNVVFGNVQGYAGIPLLVATYLYAIQLYCDFSGYTDMALGTAQLFGIRLSKNFDSPYLATSIADFWRRWHISFSRWLLDYIFRPLQMWLRDWKNLGVAISLLITFFISGVWHGIGATYIVWGLLHGLFLATAMLTGPMKKRFEKKHPLISQNRIRQGWKVFATFHLICIGWIFFRASSLTDALYILTHIASSQQGMADLFDRFKFPFHLITGILLIVSASIHFARKNGDNCMKFLHSPIWIRWPAYCLLAFTIIALKTDLNKQTFIYFQF